MPRKKAVIVTLLLALLLTSFGLASSDSLSLHWWTMDSGGGTSAGSGYQLSGTIGQIDAGVLSQPNYELAGGFWTPSGGHTIYLPSVINNY